MTGPSLAVRVRQALDEDVGSGDVTTHWSVPPTRQGRATVVSREPLVVSGLEAATLAFVLMDDALEVNVLAEDGNAVTEGTRILTVEGPLSGLLAAERVALNLLGRCSGIATLTRRYVSALRGTHTRVLDTRKTTPGWRDLEKAAVVHGGGTNHRHGLDDMVLLKENHLAAAGGIGPALEGVMRQNDRRLAVEIEVRQLAELEEVRPFAELEPPAVQRILLDNMDTPTLAEAVRHVRQWSGASVELEASGNLTLERLPEVAATGVDFVSVGALTHSAPVADMSLLVEGAEAR